MSVIALTCPHCHVDRVQFQSVAAAPLHRNPHAFTVFMTCNACTRAIAVEVALLQHQSPNPHQYAGDLTAEGRHYVVADIYPHDESPQVPDHTPDDVTKPYLQALDNLRRSNWDSAGAMARKTIDVATKVLFADEPAAIVPNVLAPRIDKLETTRRITPDLKEWAHAIRLDGNEAVHGDFTEETAKQIVSFAEPFLIYVFQLPGMLAERKAKREPPSG